MSLESTSEYDKLPEDNALIENYQPKFLARGGEHLVYTVEGHPDVVVKASTFRIKDILHENLENGRPLDSISEDQKNRLKTEIKEKNLQINQLRQYFGKEHTLSEKRYLMKVPVSYDVLNEIFKDDWKKRQPPPDSSSLTEAWSAVVVQRKSEDILDPEHHGLSCGGFVEERIDNFTQYQELNNKFVLNPSYNLEDKDLFLSLQDNPNFHDINDLLRLAEGDVGLQESLQNLTLQMIRYTEETGNILALGGKDNIIFFKKDNVWQYLLVDALPVHNEPVVSYAKEAIQRYLEDKQLTQHDRTLIMKAFNYTRIVNGLALCLGVNERLELIPEIYRNEPIHFARLLKLSNE